MKKWKALPLCLAAVMSAGVCFAGCGEETPGGDNTGNDENDQTISGSDNTGTVNESLAKQLAVKIPEKQAKGITIDIDASVDMGAGALAIDGVAKDNIESGDSEATLKMTQGTNNMFMYTFINQAGAFLYESATEVTKWDNSISLDYASMDDFVPTEDSQLNPLGLLSDIKIFNALDYEILAVSTKTALIKEETTGYIVTVDLAETAKALLGDITTITSKVTSTAKLNDLLNDAVLSSYIENCFGLIKAKTVYDLVNGVLGGEEEDMTPTAYAASESEMDLEEIMAMAAAIWAGIPAPEETDGILDWLKAIADADASILMPEATGKLGDMTLGDMGLGSDMNIAAMWKGISDSVLEKLDLIEKAKVVMTFDTNKNFVGQTVEFSVKNMPMSADGSGNTSASARAEEAKKVTASGTLAFTYSETAPQMTDISACMVTAPTSLTVTGAFVALASRVEHTADSVIWTNYKLTATVSGNSVQLALSSKAQDESQWTEVGTLTHSAKFDFNEKFTVGNETFWFEYRDSDNDGEAIELFMRLDSHNQFLANVYDANFDGSNPENEIDFSDIVELGYSTVGELLAE